jgi:hypothetical protein
MAITGLILSIDTYADRQDGNLKDSTSAPAFVVTPRINSTGHFPFTGSLINYHLNADLNIFYDQGRVGFFIFKSFDVVDLHSIVNYLQPGVFTTIKISPVVKARVFFGYLFSQTNHFRDPDSDYYTAITWYWDPSRRFHLENTSLFYDYNIKKKLANRVFASWSTRKIKLELYVWHRMVLDEGIHATSASFGFTFPIVEVSPKALLQMTSSYQRYLTKDRPSYALREGVLFTLALPISVLGN